MRPYIVAAAAALLLGGCSGMLPEPRVVEKIVPVAQAVPPPEYPAECFTDPAPFPKVKVAKGSAGASGPDLLRTLDAGRDAWRVTAKDKLVCRAGLRKDAEAPGT